MRGQGVPFSMIDPHGAQRTTANLEHERPPLITAVGNLERMSDPKQWAGRSGWPTVMVGLPKTWQQSTKPLALARPMGMSQTLMRCLGL